LGREKIVNQNLKYHHLGIPTNQKRGNEVYLDDFKMFVSGFNESEYNIEWMRILPESNLPELIKNIPHIAFEVENLDEILIGKKVLIEPNFPSPEYKVAFIEENGAPIEFLEKVK
jgi:hypothetical protein